MCGIVGYAGAPGDERLVKRMADRIVHRGPDGEGYFAGDSVALGARRLSIIDLAGSNQPIFNEDRSIVTVFNGEIYNYRELREHLRQKGHQLRTSGDTETIVHLYEDYGEASVHLLRGMFGYAIWDARRRRLVLVRDRVGIKPMYYTEQGGRLVFASEIKSILAAPDIPREIDPIAVDAYLTLQYVPGPMTLLKGIRKLPPGHLLVWEDGQARVEQYWDVVYDDDPPPMSEGVAVAQLREILEESVELHKVSDVEVGVLLSGGIDSTAVTALMNRSGQRTKSFTVGFEGGERIGETSQARHVADHIGTDHHELRIGADIADVLPRLAWYQDEPVADAAAVPTYFLSRLVSQHVKVVLTGEGGDELLGGYPRYRWLHWSSSVLSRPALAAVAAPMGTPLAAALPATIGERVRAVVSGRTLAERHIRWIANMDDALKHRVMSAGLSSMVASGTVDRVDSWMAASGSGTPLSQLMYADFKTWLPDNLLTKMDRMSMAASVEGRVPLLDHKVVEFAAMLPSRLKLTGLRTKRLLRSAVADLVPLEALQRPKTAFRVPLAEWFRGPLSALLHDTFSSPGMRQRGLFEPKALDSLIQPNGRTPRPPAQAIWNLLWLELWCQQYLDANPAADR